MRGTNVKNESMYNIGQMSNNCYDRRTAELLFLTLIETGFISTKLVETDIPRSGDSVPVASEVLTLGWRKIVPKKLVMRVVTDVEAIPVVEGAAYDGKNTECSDWNTEVDNAKSANNRNRNADEQGTERSKKRKSKDDYGKNGKRMKTWTSEEEIELTKHVLENWSHASGPCSTEIHDSFAEKSKSRTAKASKRKFENLVTLGQFLAKPLTENKTEKLLWLQANGAKGMSELIGSSEDEED